ncbi:hypothetical protein JYU34_020133, partial [Plutella xylostella]
MGFLKKEISDIKSSTANLTKDVNSLKTEVSDLKKAGVNCEKKVIALEDDLVEARLAISDLKMQLQMKEQQGRLNNLEITGLPTTKGENLYSILHSIGVKVGIPIAPTDIDFVHRVRRFQQKPATEQGSASEPPAIPNIIIKFMQRKKKNDVLAAVRARRGLSTADLGLAGPSRPVFVNDHLTPSNKVLYRSARQL